MGEQEVGRVRGGSGVPRRALVALVAVATVAGAFTSGAWAAPVFSRLPGEMAEGRYAPVAATLPNGDVLVAGGYVEEQKPLKTAELFVPASGSFQKLPGEMVEPRGEQAYAGLPSGKVLIAGGFNYLTSKTGNPLKTAEFFDPETNSFSKLSGEMTNSANR
jgi:hypothetical protein